jgi:polygalacturonase
VTYWNDEASEDGKNRLSRRVVLATTGATVSGAGCLSGGEEPTATPQPDVASPTPSPTDSNTYTGEWPTITGTEGGPTEIDVTDYGATPDDETDDTMAIRAAFEAAGKEGATVTFPAGTYRAQSKHSIPGRAQFGVPFDANVFTLA